MAQTSEAEYDKVSAAHARSEADKQPPAARPRPALMRTMRGLGRLYAAPPKFSRHPRASMAFDLADLARYIDWTPFFQTWEMKGRYPAILDHETQGPAARQLFEDAQAMLARIIEERWFVPKAVLGFWAANSVGDDIRLYTPTRAALERARAPSSPCASN